MAVTHLNDWEHNGLPMPPPWMMRSEAALKLEADLARLLARLEDHGVEGLCVDALAHFFAQTRRPGWEHDLEVLLAAQDAVDALYQRLDAELDWESWRELRELCEAICDGLEGLGMTAAGCDRDEAWATESVAASVRLRAGRCARSPKPRGGEKR